MRARRAVLHAVGALLVATLCLGAYGLVAPQSAGLPSSADGTNADPVFSDADVRRVLRDYGMGTYCDVDRVMRDSYVIPGLKMTRTLDADGNLCTCTTMTPQGVCVAGRYLLVSAYCHDRVHDSVIYRIGLRSHRLEGVIVLDGTPHVGGLAYDAKHDRVWMCGYREGKNGGATVSSLKASAWEYYDASRADGPCAVERTYYIPTLAHASFLTVKGDRLYVGDFSDTRRSRTTIQAFDIEKGGTLRQADRDETMADLQKVRSDGYLESEEGLEPEDDTVDVRNTRVMRHVVKDAARSHGDMPVPVDGALINGQAQGMALVRDLCLLSQSYGLRDSRLRVMAWDGGAWNNDLRNAQAWATFILPPMMEETEVSGGRLYLCFESGAEAYRWQDCARVDRVLVLRLKDVVGS